jgi:hypothetical protein|tara:strand:+ start:300 stop:461 length:162 start_codon:yes stop_codon:yes gene_type:complete
MNIYKYNRFGFGLVLGLVLVWFLTEIIKKLVGLVCISNTTNQTTMRLTHYDQT